MDENRVLGYGIRNKIELFQDSFATVLSFPEVPDRLLLIHENPGGSLGEEPEPLGSKTGSKPAVSTPLLHSYRAHGDAPLQLCLLGEDPVEEQPVSLAQSQPIGEP